MRIQQIHTRMWSDPKLRQSLPTSRYLFTYLLTCPERNLCGIFPLVLTHVFQNTGIELSEAEAALRDLEANGLIQQAEGFVWVVNAARYLPESKPVLEALHKEFAALAAPEPLKAAYVSHYMKVRPSRVPLETGADAVTHVSHTVGGYHTPLPYPPTIPPTSQSGESDAEPPKIEPSGTDAGISHNISYIHTDRKAKDKAKTKAKDIVGNGRRLPPDPDQESFAYKATRFFYLRLQKQYPTYVRFPFEKVAPAWTQAVERMLTLDHRSEEEIRLVFHYVRERDEFWGQVIRSPLKLRDRDRQGAYYFDLMLERAKKEEQERFRKHGGGGGRSPLGAAIEELKKKAPKLEKELSGDRGTTDRAA